MKDPALQDKLKHVRSELSEARDKRVAAKKARDKAKEAFGEVNPETFKDTKITEHPSFKDAEQATAELGTIDDKINDLTQAEVGILKMLGEEQDRSGHNPGSPEASSPTHWDGHRLLANSEDFAQAHERGVFNSRHQFGTVNIGEIASRDHAVNFLNGGATMGAALPGATPGPIGTPTAGIQPDFRGIIPPRVRRLSLLDLIPTGTTDSNVVEYVQVTAIPVGAQETAELAVKPQLGITTADATAPVRTIAGWVKAARQALNDFAGMATLINTLLPYEVRRRVEAQVLAGDGTGQNILGILNTTGIGAPSAVAGDNAADAILRAMTVIILSDNDPDFVALNPLAWQDLLLMRAAATDGSWKGEYLYGAPGTLATPTIWGLTITPSRIVAQANPLVGDSMGATILVREGVNVRTSDSDQDDFVRNRVTILAETRLAFPVWRPSAFAVASYTP